jgi:hypothetical protein
VTEGADTLGCSSGTFYDNFDFDTEDVTRVTSCSEGDTGAVIIVSTRVDMTPDPVTTTARGVLTVRQSTSPVYRVKATSGGSTTTTTPVRKHSRATSNTPVESQPITKPLCVKSMVVDLVGRVGWNRWRTAAIGRSVVVRVRE